MIPAGKYLSGLVKTGKTAGIVGVKTSLKTAFQEGAKQGLRNIDSLKGVLKNAKSFGDNIFAQVKTYGTQLDNLRLSKVLSRTADTVSNTLRSTDNLISEAAQNLRLNMGLEPQLVSGVMPSSNGKLANIADNLSAFAKKLDGSVDEVERGASRVSSKFSSEAFKGGVEAGKNLADDIILRDGSDFDDFGNLKPNVRYQAGEFARSLDGSVDEVVEAGSKAGTENSRLISGQPGVVTGGNSTNLGKNMLEEMGTKRSAKWKGYQAQHIIPSEMADHPVIQEMGMNLDDATNGKFLRIPDDAISLMSRHRGYHSTYNDFVKSKLDQIDINLSPENLQVEVKKLQRNLNGLQSKELPLYPNQGATLELWERFYNNLD